MKRIKVIKNGVVKVQTQGEVAEIDARLASWIAKGKLGKPDRWVREGDEDITQALETRQVEVEPAQPEQTITHEDGTTEVIPAKPAVFVTEYRLAAEYTIITEDITNELEKNRINQESQDLLNKTDWKVLRHIREKALGVITSLTEEQYLQLEQSRADAAAKIVK